jgi:hypothetical protein
MVLLTKNVKKLLENYCIWFLGFLQPLFHFHFLPLIIDILQVSPLHLPGKVH